MQEMASSMHKSLVPLGGVPLLQRICQLLESAEVNETIVVTGYRGEQVRSALNGCSELELKITFAENPEWRKSNGLSVLAASHLLTGNYLLMMADHIFDPNILSGLGRLSLEHDEVVLAVDRKIDDIYDIEDATKVSLVGDRIVGIGKELETYNAVDTGLFLCSPALVKALTTATKKGDCSLSDGMRMLAEVGKLRYFDVGDAWWQDVDTPGALEHAEHLLRTYS